MLSERMAASSHESGRVRAAGSFEEQAREARRRAKVIREVLTKP
jgi:hypothetical protein